MLLHSQFNTSLWFMKTRNEAPSVVKKSVRKTGARSLLSILIVDNSLINYKSLYRFGTSLKKQSHYIFNGGAFELEYECRKPF